MLLLSLSRENALSWEQMVRQFGVYTVDQEDCLVWIPCPPGLWLAVGRKSMTTVTGAVAASDRERPLQIKSRGLSRLLLWGTRFLFPPDEIGPLGFLQWGLLFWKSLGVHRNNSCTGTSVKVKQEWNLGRLQTGWISVQCFGCLSLWGASGCFPWLW